MGKFHKKWSFPGDVLIYIASIFPAENLSLEIVSISPFRAFSNEQAALKYRGLLFLINII